MLPPTGDLTFLFSDIEGSSQLWEKHPQAMALALAQHDALLRGIFVEHGGYVFKTMGDAFCVAFGNPLSASTAALAAQRQLGTQTWGETGPLRVRMALHSGTAEERDGDYFGRTLNRVARLLAAGHGGQTLFSHITSERVGEHLPDGISLRDLGERRLKDLNRPERIFQVVAPDLRADFPPLRSLEVLPNNLPAQVTSFIGRAAEMAEVKRLLASTRLLTLTGPGGTGKTRLSLQVAAEVLETFSHGVWLVELATVCDGALIHEALASAMEVREEAGHPPLDALIHALRGRRLLLALARYWDVRSYLTEARAQYAELLAKMDESVAAPVRARACRGAGALAWCQDEDKEAMRLLTRGMKISEPLGMRREVGILHALLGFVERNEGHYETARAHFEKATAFGRELDFDTLTALALSGLGTVATDAATACQCMSESLAAFHRLGDKWMIGILSWAFAAASIKGKNHAAARRHLIAATAQFRELRNKWFIPYVLEAFADIASHDGRIVLAVRLYGASSVLRDGQGLGLSPTEKIEYEGTLRSLRERIASDTFDTEWKAGCGLRSDDAIELAIQD